MRVLVTGATGFIGRHTVEQLLGDGHDVAPLPAALLGTTDGEALLRTAAPEAVLHLAWYAEPRDYLSNVAENLLALERSTWLLRQIAAHEARTRVVVAGTGLEASGGSVGSSPYVAAKRAVHDLGGAVAAAANLSFACAHVFWVHGPGERPERGIPSVVRGLLSGQVVPVGAGTHRRDYLHVLDVAAALAALVGRPDLTGQVDVCSGESVPMRDVFELVAAEIGGTGRLQVGARPPDALADDAPDGDPATLRSIGWRPRYTLRSGLQDTIAWWRVKARASEVEGSR